MPTTNAVTYSGTRVDPVIAAEDATEAMMRVKLVASTTYVAGTILGEVTATPGLFGAYASGASDGTQNPRCILQYSAVTDGSSVITNYGEWGTTAITAPVYTKGIFRTQDLVGLDTNAVAKLTATLIEGTVTTGLIRI